MALGDFWLQSNNGRKISLENLNELKKSDLKGNPELIKLFDFFNTNKSNGSEEVLDKEELTSLFNTMSGAAKLNGNTSVFEVDEAEDYINTTQTSEGQTLKQLGVKASDLFDFISALLPKNENHTTQVQSGLEALQQSYTPEEIEDLSIQTVTDDVRKARQVFNSQYENQGVVSDFVNGTKETFDTEFAASRVNRFLMREELCAALLAKSKSEEGLSEKEYLESKINLAVRMLPKLENSSLKSSIIKNILSLGLYKGFGNKTKAEQERIAEEVEIELLKDALRRLKPEDLTLFIQRVTAMSDAEYAETAGQVVENMINQSLQEKIRDNQKPMADTNQGFIKHQPVPGSIEYIEQHNDVYRTMTFEETFEAERGVQYNPDNIMDYAEKDAKMQFLLGMHNKREQIYNILHDATVTVDGNNKFGAPDARAIKPCEEQLEAAIIQALRNLYGDDVEKMQEGLNKLGIKNLKIIQSGGENDLLHPMKLVYDYGNDENPDPLIKKTDLNGYDLVNIANKLQNYVDTNYQNALGGKTLEEYGQEVNSAYQMAYGARNAQHMAEAFAESQQEGVQTVKTAVQGVGMAVMIAGQLVPVGGQVAAAMTMGGLAASTFGSVSVSALENFTKAGGATEEDKKEMLKELGVSIALVSSGMGIGKTSGAAFRALVIKNCPKLLAYASEVGIDATMSLVADYAITGQIDLSGEGIAQLQCILVGILHAKGNFGTYINTHAGDVTTKPSDLTSKPKIDDLSFAKEEGKTEVNKPKTEVTDNKKAKTEDTNLSSSKKTNDISDDEFFKMLEAYSGKNNAQRRAEFNDIQGLTVKKKAEFYARYAKLYAKLKQTGIPENIIDNIKCIFAQNFKFGSIIPDQDLIILAEALKSDKRLNALAETLISCDDISPRDVCMILNNQVHHTNLKDVDIVIDAHRKSANQFTKGYRGMLNVKVARPLDQDLHDLLKLVVNDQQTPADVLRAIVNDVGWSKMKQYPLHDYFRSYWELIDKESLLPPEYKKFSAEALNRLSQNINLIVDDEINSLKQAKEKSDKALVSEMRRVIYNLGYSLGKNRMMTTEDVQVLSLRLEMIADGDYVNKNAIEQTYAKLIDILENVRPTSKPLENNCPHGEIIPSLDRNLNTIEEFFVNEGIKYKKVEDGEDIVVRAEIPCSNEFDNIYKINEYRYDKNGNLKKVQKDAENQVS